jgi:hypothetical protein
MDVTLDPIETATSQAGRALVDGQIARIVPIRPKRESLYTIYALASAWQFDDWHYYGKE